MPFISLSSGLLFLYFYPFWGQVFSPLWISDGPKVFNISKATLIFWHFNLSFSSVTINFRDWIAITCPSPIDSHLESSISLSPLSLLHQSCWLGPLNILEIHPFFSTPLTMNWVKIHIISCLDSYHKLLMALHFPLNVYSPLYHLCQWEYSWSSNQTHSCSAYLPTIPLYGPWKKKKNLLLAHIPGLFVPIPHLSLQFFLSSVPYAHSSIIIASNYFQLFKYRILSLTSETGCL